MPLAETYGRIMPLQNYRAREIHPGDRLKIEVRGRAGEQLLIEGRIDSVPEGYGNVVTKLVLVDATARPLA